MARFYEKIIGCRNEGIYRVVTLFGIKFRYKNARIQTLAEIKKLSNQCANLAASIKTLSDSSKRSHETTNALLSKELAELNSELEKFSEHSGINYQALLEKLIEANNHMDSHAEMLMAVYKLQGTNHQGTEQKLENANNLLSSNSKQLTEIGIMQEKAREVQELNRQTLIQRLDDMHGIVKTNVEWTGLLLETEYIFARFYDYPFEREFLVPFFHYMERPDFEERYLALVHNMDSSSIREINKILSRVNMVKEKPAQPHYNFFSIQEQAERTKLVTKFQDRILRISDNLYAYDKYLLPVRHFEICVFLYKHGIELVRDKGSVREKDIIDAGAFIGDSALVLSDYTDKKIYSFEPSPQNIDLLKKTLEINKLSKVIPVQKALWSSETDLELNIAASASASSLFKLYGLEYEDKPPVKVHTVVLDQFVQEKSLNVGLIKVDLEGAELEFLKGAEHTIRTQKPVLLLSIYHKPSDFFELKPMLEQWVPEYEFSVFNPVDWGILLETMIIAQPKNSLSKNHE